GCEQVVRHQVLSELEPVQREPRKHLALSGDRCGQHDIERRDAVGRDHHEVLPRLEDVADLPARVQLDRHPAHHSSTSSFSSRANTPSRCSTNGPSRKSDQNSSFDIAPVGSASAHASSRKCSASSHEREAARCTMRYASSRESPASTSASSTRWEKNTPPVESKLARMRSGKICMPSTTVCARSSM